MQLTLEHPVFKILSEIIKEEGLEAYVIGGYVRDLLLQRPSKDIDIVVHGSGIALAEEAARRLGNLHVSVFKNFGTAMFRYQGEEIDVMPYGAEACAQCEVIYEDFPGWKESTYGVTRWEDLPESAKRYLHRLSEVAGCPIAVVSTGPDRSQTIMLDNPFNK